MPNLTRPLDEVVESLMDPARDAQPSWGALPVDDRVRALADLPRVLADNLDRIAETIHRENGKPTAEAVAHEAAPAVALARHHLDQAPAVLGDHCIRLPNLPHRTAVRHHRPYGVVVAIAPWNFPFFIPFSQVLPALLAGNAVILKPSELTPECGRLLVDLVRETGLPEGVLQVAIGDGALGAGLVEARPDKVLFTGSVATGRQVMAAAAQHPIPVGLELGGVDALVVRADADLEFTASAIAWGATFNGGQACCSVERLLVHQSIADRLQARVADKLRRIDTRHDLGPAIDERQLATWQRHVDAATADGLTVDGGRPLPDRRFEPTMVAGDAVTTSLVWNEETFGPVVAVATFDSDETAVALHNATRYGLTASVFSADVAAAQRMARQLNAGAVAVNEVAATMYSSPELPWGGVGESGFGRSHGTDALLDAAWVQVVESPRGAVFGPKRPWWYPYGFELEGAMKDVGRAFAATTTPRRAASLARAARQLATMLTRQRKL
jgi:succinate-semialdehyde dehydrogenase/glutarate-semialdehyde dehydrogenase